MMTFLLVLTIVLIAFGCGLWVGFRYGVESLRERLEDLERVADPGTRTAGQPTNADGPVARVTQGRVLQRRRWDLHN